MCLIIDTYRTAKLRAKWEANGTEAVTCYKVMAIRWATLRSPFYDRITWTPGEHFSGRGSPGLAQTRTDPYTDVARTGFHVFMSRDHAEHLAGYVCRQGMAPASAIVPVRCKVADFVGIGHSARKAVFTHVTLSKTAHKRALREARKL